MDDGGSIKLPVKTLSFILAVVAVGVGTVGVVAVGVVIDDVDPWSDHQTRTEMSESGNK